MISPHYFRWWARSAQRWGPQYGDRSFELASGCMLTRLYEIEDHVLRSGVRIG